LVSLVRKVIVVAVEAGMNHEKIISMMPYVNM
jgi:hypothetical protein